MLIEVDNRFAEVTFTATASIYKLGSCRVAFKKIDDLESIMVTSNVQLGPGQFRVIKELNRSARFLLHKLTLAFALTFGGFHFLVHLVICHNISSESLFARCLFGVEFRVKCSTAGVNCCSLAIKICEFFI